MSITMASLLLSGIAIMASIYATAKARDNSSRLLAIEEQRESDRLVDRSKASLSVRREKDGSSYRLYISNSGNAAAKNVEITMNGKPILEHKVIPQGEQEKKIIGPDSEVSYILAESMGKGNNPPYIIVISWDDDSDKKGRYETTVS
ncbi:MAG: hypothetical protein OEZ32_11250 [Nitrospinota bacterium]|nr:hypothetical protein [Nitrospinota bacterium]